MSPKHYLTVARDEMEAIATATRELEGLRTDVEIRLPLRDIHRQAYALALTAAIDDMCTERCEHGEHPDRPLAAVLDYGLAACEACSGWMMQRAAGRKALLACSLCGGAGPLAQGRLDLESGWTVIASVCGDCARYAPVERQAA